MRSMSLPMPREPWAMYSQPSSSAIWTSSSTISGRESALKRK